MEYEACDGDLSGKGILQQKNRRKTKTLPRRTTGMLTITETAIETMKMAVAVGMATSI